MTGETVNDDCHRILETEPGFCLKAIAARRMRTMFSELFAGTRDLPRRPDGFRPIIILHDLFDLV